MSFSTPLLSWEVLPLEKRVWREVYKPRFCLDDLDSLAPYSSANYTYEPTSRVFRERHHDMYSNIFLRNCTTLLPLVLYQLTRYDISVLCPLLTILGTTRIVVGIDLSE